MRKSLHSVRVECEFEKNAVGEKFTILKQRSSVRNINIFSSTLKNEINI